MDPGDEDKYPSTPNEKATIPEQPNATVQPITIADGPDTHGTLNQLPSKSESYEIGVAETIGHRPRMEDSYGFVVDFHAIRGQGVFAIYDGHGNKLTAEWAGGEFHKHLLQAIYDNPNAPIETVFQDMFDSMDSALSRRSVQSANWAASGCTAAVAFLRFEDNYVEEEIEVEVEVGVPDENKPQDPEKGKNITGDQEMDKDTPEREKDKNIPDGKSMDEDTPQPEAKKKKKRVRMIKPDPRAQFFAPALPSALLKYYNPDSPTPDSPPPHIPYTVPPRDTRRVLYTANAGDSRIVLSRGGVAERLTYDHKVSDPQEIKRVKDLRGVFWRGRVLGQLNITRGLGDHEAQQGYSIKKFVVPTPYTKRVELNNDDNFIILACDGVWDVLNDQEAVDHIQHIEDPKLASKMLLELAMQKETRDNVTVMVVRLKPRN